MGRKQQREASAASPEIDSVSGLKVVSEPSRIRRELGLKLLVFAAGAVLMGLEIAGSRILAPHFGNSIFVWGSLIAVFLTAMSIGSYLGGWLADRYPSPLLLSLICAVVSLWILALSVLASSFCQSLVAAGLNEESGPLLASLALFLPPSIGMGVVSPFAVRLLILSMHTIGKTSGSISALSTLGSIAGTMITTFILIPHLGVSHILWGLGCTLLISSFFVLPSLKGRAGASMVCMLCMAILLLAAAGGPQRTLEGGQKLVLDVSTPYHNIQVIDDPNHNLRELRFDRYTESAVSLFPPHASQAAYTNFFHLAFLAKPELQHALFIGAGGGVGPRTFHMHRPDMMIDVVDIDPKVLEIASSQFFLKASPKIRLTAEDGRSFLRLSHDRYDCVVIDAFTIGGRIPFHLITREFFELCRQRMTDDGVLLINLNSALSGRRSQIYRSIHQTLATVFPQVDTFALNHSNRSPTQTTNIILMASRDPREIAESELMSRAEQYESGSPVDRGTMIEVVNDHVAVPPDTSSAPLFTDDYAPIESMSF